jgi:hypothetical protein
MTSIFFFFVFPPFFLAVPYFVALCCKSRCNFFMEKKIKPYFSLHAQLFPFFLRKLKIERKEENME